uniref:Uncharacterized protein n=1 Tax=Arion vulgaris TaxID=1028688 RepID=A0A0B6ZPZ2_9EUPU
MLLSKRSVVLLLVTFEVYISAQASSTKLPESPTSNIAAIMKRLQKKGQVRPRRSYIDNRIDTFPIEPVYFSQRNHDSSQQPEPDHSFQHPYGFDMDHDSELDLLSSLGIKEVPLKGEHHAPVLPHQQHSEPLDLVSLLIDDGDLKDGPEFDFSPLPPVLDVTAPVSERAEKEAATIMDEFLNFLALKESGALNDCLKRQQ